MLTLLHTIILTVVMNGAVTVNNSLYYYGDFGNPGIFYGQEVYNSEGELADFEVFLRLGW